MNSRPKNSAKSDYERIQLLRRVTVPCRPTHHTIDEAVRGPALVSWVSSRASADRILALMTPDIQPASTRPKWAGHPQVTSEVSTMQPTEGLRNWKRPRRQVFWHLSVCSVVNGARAPRLATRDQPSPSKPVHPHDSCVLYIRPGESSRLVRSYHKPHSLGTPPSIMEGSHISMAIVTRAGLFVAFSVARRTCSSSAGP